jgi:hypothetical protein
MMRLKPSDTFTLRAFPVLALEYYPRNSPPVQIAKLFAGFLFVSLEREKRDTL